MVRDRGGARRRPEADQTGGDQAGQAAAERQRDMNQHTAQRREVDALAGVRQLQAHLAVVAIVRS
jgi:hypothetical protein